MRLKVMDKMKTLPGPRYRHQGPGSGEEFREDHLVRAFDAAVGESNILVVDMDGAPRGYPTSFLEEAFGGLARLRGTKLVQDNIDIRCSSEPMLRREIMHYIKYGEKEKTPPFELPEAGK